MCSGLLCSVSPSLERLRSSFKTSSTEGGRNRRKTIPFDANSARHPAASLTIERT